MFNWEEGVPLDQQRLIYGGIQLEDSSDIIILESDTNITAENLMKKHVLTQRKPI